MVRVRRGTPARGGDRSEIGVLCADLQHKLGSFSPVVPRRDLVAMAEQILDKVKKLPEDKDGT